MPTPSGSISTHRLEDADVGADLVQAQCRRQPADAGAGDQNRHDTPSRFGDVMTWEPVCGQPRRPPAAAGDGRAGGAPLNSRPSWEDQKCISSHYAPGFPCFAFQSRPRRSRCRLHGRAARLQGQPAAELPDFLKLNPKAACRPGIVGFILSRRVQRSAFLYRPELSDATPRRSTTPSRSRRCNPSTAISAPRFMSPIRTRVAAIAGRRRNPPGPDMRSG